MTHSVARKGRSTILLPTDFQEPARRAFLHAVKLATALGTQLTIVHIVKMPTDPSNAVSNSRLLRSLRTAAWLELGHLVRIAGESGASAKPLLRYGDPIGCILETAARIHAEMIVMGTEGRTGWDRLRIGSTAEGLIRGAPCPVLTVHGGLAGDVFRHPAKVRLRRVLVATDFSRDADSALRVVRGLASRLHATVHVVHAAPSSPASKHAEHMLGQQVQDLRDGGVKTDGACVPGEPVETILAQAADYHADLLVVGTSGRQGLSRMVRGSVAATLVKRAGCPVLTVRRARVLEITR